MDILQEMLKIYILDMGVKILISDYNHLYKEQMINANDCKIGHTKDISCVNSLRPRDAYMSQ